MISNGLYGAAFSKSEAINQQNEISLLRQRFSVLNPRIQKSEAVNWAIEAYFRGIRVSG